MLNSVQSGNSKNSVMLDVNKQIKNSITITPYDILDALKNIKCGKSSGIDGISAEHFVFAHSCIHVLLSLLFSAFITHGYLPGMFMKTAIVPIIKNKTGDTSDKNNDRPIALVTAASKIFELCLSVILENTCLHTINNLVSRVNIQLIFAYNDNDNENLLFSHQT